MTTIIKRQQGFFLMEALVALLIFSLGILGMIAMSSASVSAQSDSQYRTDAANFASDIAAEMALSVDRTSAATIANSLSTFAHHTEGADGEFTGAASTNQHVIDWVARVSSGAKALPGATDSSQQITVDASSNNRVVITVCWKAPSDRHMRKHVLVTYVN